MASVRRLPTLEPSAASIGELLATGGHSFSFEFFPPKTDEGERQLWQAIRELEPLQPTFVSVTYGAGGSTRDRTVRVTERIHEETTLPADGAPHLRRLHRRRAAPGHRVLRRRRGAQRARAARRPARRPRRDLGAAPRAASRTPTSSWRCVRSLGDFCVGVAAFPEGHPESRLARPRRPRPRGQGRRPARSSPSRSCSSGPRTTSRSSTGPAPLGCDDADRPGHHAGHERQPDRALRRAVRAPRSPTSSPTRFHAVGDDADAVHALGVEVATELATELLEAGAPGPALLHAEPLDLDARDLHRTRTRADRVASGPAPSRRRAPTEPGGARLLGGAKKMAGSRHGAISHGDGTRAGGGGVRRGDVAAGCCGAGGEPERRHGARYLRDGADP